RMTLDEIDRAAQAELPSIRRGQHYGIAHAGRIVIRVERHSKTEFEMQRLPAFFHIHPAREPHAEIATQRLDFILPDALDRGGELVVIARGGVRHGAIEELKRTREI